MNALIQSLTKKVGYLLAAIIIFAAVIVCVTRIVTPVLDHHRADFEKIASQFLKTPVTIKNVRVSWYHYQPVIRLNDVFILQAESNKPIFQIKKVSLLISILKSLRQWQVVTNGIMVSGAELNISQSAKGEWTVKEFSTLPFNQDTSQSETKFTDVMAWLSSEPNLILRDIDLHYTGIGKQNRYVTLYKLSFENSDIEHKIIGNAILHQEIPTEVKLNAKWNGTITDIPGIKARLYLYVSGLSLPQWSNGISLKGWQIKQGIASAKIWATWEKETFQQIQSTVQSYGLALFSDKDKVTHHINRLSGNVGWKREGSREIIAGDDILLDLPHHLWPVTGFYMTLQPDAKNGLVPHTLNVAYVDLRDIQPFLFSMPDILPDTVRDMLSTMKVSGSLQNMSIDREHLSFATHFSQLTVSPFKQYPGVENLGGTIKWNGSQGELKLHGARTVLHYDSMFKNTILFDQVLGDVTIQQDAKKSWLLNIAGLHLLNSEMATNLSGTLTFAPNKSPVADMNANATMKQVKNISHYLPLSILDKKLADWLQHAFLSGEILSAHAVLKGRMADFPFDHGKGEFSIATKINNIDLRFAPDWPLLNRINGELTFLNRQLTIDIDHAETFGIPVSNLHGVIPYIGDAKPQILEVAISEIEADLGTVMKYVHASPLEKNIGKMFRGVDLQGLVGLKLNLKIPLGDTDKTTVKGALAIHDSVMSLAEWNIKLNHLNGNVDFTENKTEASNINAELFNQLLQFNLATVEKSNNNGIVRATFTNRFNILDLENWLKLPFSKVIKGTAMINGIVDLSMKNPVEVHLRSDLVGATVDLMEQYGKKENEARDFAADIILQNNKPMRVKLNYGKLFSTAMVLDREQDTYHLLGANLRFGAGEAEWPASSGFYITGQFDVLDWDKINALRQGQSGDNKLFSFTELKGIDVNINRAILSGQTLNKVNIQVVPQDKNWDVDISSQELVGGLIIPIKLNRQSSISAQFQKINLHAIANSKQSPMQLDIKSLPAIYLTASNVRYNDIPVGTIVFNAVPALYGLSIQALHITSPYIDLRASGEWRQNGKNYVTHLQGSATSEKVSQLLNNLGLTVNNFIATNGNLNFNLVWPDTLFSPSLATMHGRAVLTLGQGRIVDIGDNDAKMDLGRMLSIFSLQTIPRRLTLDFSDVFQKGYSFDSLRGDFIIDNGELSTTNMRFDGPVAKVGINGKIGLINKNYRFILSVTAHVTSSIPVAATLLTGNPLIGLGALAVNTVIGSKVSSVTTVYYAVTGPWNNPVWKSIKSGNR